MAFARLFHPDAAGLITPLLRVCETVRPLWFSVFSCAFPKFSAPRDTREPGQVSVNREIVRPPGAISEGFDMHLVGDCDEVVQYLCWRLGWDLPPPSPGAHVPADASACHAEENPEAALGRALSEGKEEGLGVDNGSNVSSTGTSVHYPPPYPVLEHPNRYYFPSSVQWKEGSVVGAGARASSDSHGCAENDASDSAEEFTEVITW